MLTHSQVWAAIDALAEREQMTASGLARRSGLDPTSFNKSKRTTEAGRLRWPSTESISKALKATQTSFTDFVALIEQPDHNGLGEFSNGIMGSMPLPSTQSVPLLGFAEAGVGGFFDDGGFPAGQGWDQIHFPNGEHEQVYALEVSGDSMMPLYREGDQLIVAPGANVRRGDRVVVKTNDGEVMAKVLARKTAKSVEVQSLNPDHPNRTFDISEIEWIARIIWASQ